MMIMWKMKDGAGRLFSPEESAGEETGARYRRERVIVKNFCTLPKAAESVSQMAG